MSHSPIKPHPSSQTTMPSKIKLASAPIDLHPSTSIEIKREEPDAEPSIPLVAASQLTSTQIAITNTPTAIPTTTPVLSHTSTPTFTPIATSTASTPILISTPTVPNIRKSGRQGRPQKERTLIKNKPTETVNYPCHEQAQLSELHCQKLRELDVYPTNGVSNYSRSIPFKGAKESFLKKTGRNRFDVFEYRFTAPNIKGEDKQWWVMWDYYNGLVRVHDLFDCCKPGKTEPGNAVKEKINPGLQNVCHNITGGNLHAQGYWIPFIAAKALAAKFCFRIRFALTIIFGDDFPSQCLPETHPDFGKYQISPGIIRSCEEISTQQYAIETQRTTPAPSTPLNLSPSVSSAATPSSLLGDKYQRISVTPEWTPANRYFDPVRGGYTNGSSSSSGSQSSQPIRPKYSATRAKAMVKKVAKVHKAPRGVSSATADNLSTPSLKTALHSGAKSAPLPLMGNFSPAPSSNADKLTRRGVTGTRRPGNWNIGIQSGMSPGNVPQTGDGINVTTDASADRSYPSARKHLLSPLEGPKRSSGKRLDPRHAAWSSPEPIPHRPSGVTLAGPTPETHEEPARKKSKIAPSEPRVYTNPYMNPITFCAGTFTNPHRASRDSSIPQPANPYTRRRYDELVSSQVEETADDLLAVEAASQLMELQRRNYDRDFTQRKKEIKTTLKRRRSN